MSLFSRTKLSATKSTSNCAARAKSGGGHYLCAHAVFALSQHDDFQQTVVDQDRVASGNVLYKSGVINVHGILFLLLCAPHRELQNVARFQMQIGFQFTGANSWALRIEENCNWAAGSLRQPANPRHNV